MARNHHRSRRDIHALRATSAVAIGTLLAAGLTIPSSAAVTYSPNVGVVNVYPTVFSAASGTNVTVTVVNPAGTPSYLTPNTTAQFTNCTQGVPDGAASAGGTMVPTASSPSNGGQEANSIAVFSVPQPMLGTSLPVVCNLTLSDPANGSGPIGQGTPMNTAFTFMASAPTLTSITPSTFAATPASLPLVTIQGANLSGIAFNNTANATAAPLSLPGAASVFMTNCTVNSGAYGNPVVNPIGIFNPPIASKPGGGYQNYATLNGNSISTLLSNGVMASTCDVVVPIPAISGNIGGHDYLALSQAFTWQPPTQAPIKIAVTNPYHASGTPRSGIADASLYLSVLGTPSAAATTSQGCTTGGAWEGPSTSDTALAVSGSGLNSVAFTSLSDYDAVNHTGTLTICPTISSGNLYLSNGPLNGTAPSPQTSTTRFGLVEFTYNNNGLDADLTLIDQIGMSMSMSMSNGGTRVPGSYRDTGCLVEIVNDLSNQSVNMSNWSTSSVSGGITAYSSTTPPTTPAAGAWTAADLQDNASWVRILGPSQNAAAYPSAQTYATSITGPLTINDHLGDATFNGPFNYTATLSGGVWTLSGTVSYPAGSSVVNGPTLQVSQAGLYGADPNGGTGYQVFAQNGPFTASWSGSPANGTYDFSGSWAADGGAPASMQNTVKTIYRDFITAFSYGYWGSSLGGGTNTGPLATNFTGDPLTQAYKNAQPSFPQESGAQVAWDVYDQVIRSRSNIGSSDNPKPSGAYGMPYSDTYVPSAQSPNQDQTNVDTWNLTLGDPSACPTKAGPTLLPPSQTVTTAPNKPILDLAPGSSPVKTRDMVEFTATGFSGPVTYSLLNAAGTAPAVLPPPLQFSTSTGAITGTPTSTMAPTTFTVSGTDGTNTATAKVTLTVAGRTLYPPAQSVAGTVGMSLASKALTPYGFGTAPTFSAAGLPAWATIDPTTGIISGIPTVAQPATPYVVTGQGAKGSATATVTITVTSAASIRPATQTLQGTVNRALAPSTAYTTAGFVGSPTYTISPALPPNLQLNASTGVITGTPAAAQPPATYTVTAQDRSGNSATAQVTLTVGTSGRALAPSQQTLSGKVGTYVASQQMTASGFTNAVTYSLSPAPPPGMTFNSSSGVLSGTPTQDWSQTYVITAAGKTSQATAALTVQVTGGAAPTRSLSPFQQNVNGTVGTYTASGTWTPNGFQNAVTYTLSAAPPPGMQFSSSTGVLSGTPAQTWSQTYVVTAKGATTQATAALTVVITPGTAPSGTRGLTPNQQTLTGIVGNQLSSSPMQASGFSNAVTYSLSASPPPGMGFSPSTGVLYGAPTQEWSQTYVITAQGRTSQATAALTVLIGAPASPTPGPGPRPGPTPTSAPAPTNTPAPAPTNTPAPAPTNTPAPAPTNTPAPAPTNTPAPAPTNTPAPAPSPSGGGGGGGGCPAGTVPISGPSGTTCGVVT